MRIVDLFSGAGGLTFGFYYSLINNQFEQNMKNEIVFANEFNEFAAKAFKLNFPNVNMIERSITELDDKEICDLIGNQPIDVIIGGPPCQSFSTVGNRRFDDRARLYEQYLRVSAVIKPKAFIFENVKGILSMKDDGGLKIIDKIKYAFEKIGNDLGYTVDYKTLDAVNYGVPQHRERVFIVGIRRDLHYKWTFPIGNNEVITLSQAISDLPNIHQGESGCKYSQHPKNEYQKLMRGEEPITYHTAAKHGDKIRTVIANVNQGEGHDDYNLKVERGEIANAVKLTSGYKNTYGRLWADRPCTTITHNMSTPSGLRCIHYEQDRALTPREGARIQSFPDWFKFYGPLTHIKTQIGNAVPPLLSIALARKLEEVLAQNG